MCVHLCVERCSRRGIQGQTEGALLPGNRRPIRSSGNEALTRQAPPERCYQHKKRAHTWNKSMEQILRIRYPTLLYLRPGDHDVSALTACCCLNSRAACFRLVVVGWCLLLFTLLFFFIVVFFSGTQDEWASAEKAQKGRRRSRGSNEAKAIHYGDSSASETTGHEGENQVKLSSPLSFLQFQPGPSGVVIDLNKKPRLDFSSASGTTKVGF